MKLSLPLMGLALTLLPNRPAFAQTENRSLPSIPPDTLEFQVSPWHADCPEIYVGLAANCGIPQGTGAPFGISVPLAPVYAAGSAASSARAFSSQLVAAEAKEPATLGVAMNGLLTVYSVHPFEQTKLPPYVQVRLELFEPVHALCAQSVRWKPDFEYPPMICAGFNLNAKPNTQWGATVTLRARHAQPSVQSSSSVTGQ